MLQNQSPPPRSGTNEVFANSPSAPRRWLSALGATLLIASAAGCASPGQPRPPSLDLPETVQDLTAKRIGDEVQLHWTTPEKTTDRIAVKGPMTASICRIANPALRNLHPDQAASGPIRPQSRPSTLFPSPSPSIPPTLLAYRIEILNSKGHSAGLSPDAFAAAGAAPPPVESSAQPQPATAPCSSGNKPPTPPPSSSTVSL